MKVRKILNMGHSRGLTLPFPFFQRWDYCIVEVIDSTDDSITLKFKGVGNAQNNRDKTANRQKS